MPALVKEVGRRLLDDGFYVNLGIFPAVPASMGGVRFHMHRGLDLSDDAFLDSLAHHYKATLTEAGVTPDTLARSFRMPHLQDVDLSPRAPEALLVEELGMQSIDVVQLVDLIEMVMDVELHGLDLSEVETVEELYWELVAGGDDGGDSVVAGLAHHAAGGLPHEAALRAWLPDDPSADVGTLVGMLARRAAVTPTKRDTTPGRSHSSGLSFFTATERPSAGSWARWTVPIPPWPTTRSICSSGMGGRRRVTDAT